MPGGRAWLAWDEVSKRESLGMRSGESGKRFIVSVTDSSVTNIALVPRPTPFYLLFAFTIMHEVENLSSTLVYYCECKWEVKTGWPGNEAMTNRSPWSACSQMPPCLAGRGSIWAVACGSWDNWWPADNTTVKIWLCSTFHTHNP